MKYSSWQIVATGKRYYLKRYEIPIVDGKLKWKRYQGKYDTSDRSKVEALARRLNASYEQEKREAEQRYDDLHPYINKLLVDKFLKERGHRVTSKEQVKTSHANLRKVFDYFVFKKMLPDPTGWKKYEFDFGDVLLKAGYSLSAIQKTQITANQYIDFLNKTYPDQLSVPKLELLSKAKKDLIRAKNELDDNERGQFIPSEHYVLIINAALQIGIKEHIQLGYHYGLRRAEVLGLSTEHLKKGYLHVTRQLVNIEPTYTPTKGRMMRETPHWLATPKDAHYWISKLKIMHPDTLSDEFAKTIKKVNESAELELDYTFHDLRHTFITNVVRKYPIVDVARAVGHKDIRTTQEYLEDDRDLDDEVWTPD